MANSTSGTPAPSTTPGATTPPDATPPCVIDNTIVEFRIIDDNAHPDFYRGEFGFDWLRIKEAPSDITIESPYVKSKDNSINGSVISGYDSSTSNLGEIEAQNKIKTEYETFPINRPATTHRDLTYYIPCLNLYPKEGLTYNSLFNADRPPYQAKLRLIVDIKDQAPEKIAVEFKHKFFSIEGTGEIKKINNELSEYILPKENSNYTITPDDANTSKVILKKGSTDPEIITVSCLKEFSAKDYFNVYSYPPACSANKTKKLVGKLLLNPNDRSHRKVAKIALIQVKTNITGNDENTGAFATTGEGFADEVKMLYKAFYQALIYPQIITKAKNEKQVKEDICLDLTNDPKFKTYGEFIKHDISITSSTGTIIDTEISTNMVVASPLSHVAISNTEIKNGILTGNVAGTTDSGGRTIPPFSINATITPPDASGNFTATFDSTSVLTSPGYTIQVVLNITGQITGTRLNFIQDNFGVYLENELNQQYPDNRLLEDFFLVFAFGELVQERGGITYGNVDAIFRYTTKWETKFRQTMFVYSKRKNATLSHELLHAFDLRHTHDDRDRRNPNAILEANIRYLFRSKGNQSAQVPDATTNIMSYNEYRHSTWHWQWQIMQQNVQIKFPRGTQSGIIR